MRTYKDTKFIARVVSDGLRTDVTDQNKAHSEAFKFVFEPGNGTRYEMVLARFGEELFVGITNFRSSYCFTKAEHPNYVAEKLRLSEGDAEEITKVINACFV